MTRYEKYANKARHVASLEAFIYHFRAVFVFVGTAALVVGATLVGLKGCITNTVCDASYVYGTSFSPTASAFLSTASFEYASAEGDDWSEVAPTLVGNYKLCSYAKNNFGGYDYGSFFYFSIVKKPIVITLASTCEYGEKPLLSASSLVDGDSIIDYQVKYSDATSLSPTASLSISSLTIENQKGIDVTDCYDISSPSQAMSLSKRPITVSFSNATKTYDGTALENETDLISSGSLASGDSLSVSGFSTLSSAGTIENSATIKIINSDHLDVTNCYDITRQSGLLTIKKRPLSLASASLSKVYDGDVITDEEVSLTSGSLASGDSLTFAYSNETHKDVGSFDNTFSPTIKNQAGDIVTSNYDLTLSYGTLVVTSRPLQLTSLSAAKTYDGTSLEEKGYQIISGSLASNDVLKVVSSSSLIDVGNSTNQLTYEIDDASGNAVTSDYRITNEYGTLSVTKRQLKITTKSQSKTYDGTAILGNQYILDGLADGDTFSPTSYASLTDAGTCDNQVLGKITASNGADRTSDYDISYVPGTLTVTKRAITLEKETLTQVYNGTPLQEDYQIEGDGLAPNQSLQTQTEITNVGTATGTQKIKIVDASKNDVTKNYDITYSEATTLSVTARPITITTQDESKVYDGTALFGDCHGVAVTEGSLASGDSIVALSSENSIVDVGTADNIADLSTLKIQNSAGDDVTKNYDVRCKNNGKLIINSRAISITLSDASKVYDGTILSTSSYFISNPGLASDEKLEISTDSSLGPDVGTKTRSLSSSCRIFNAANEETTSNYKISFIYGKLTISQRPITLTVNSESKVYDGTPLTSKGLAYKTSGLLSGDSISLSLEKASITDVGSVSVQADSSSLVIKDASGKDVTQDYAPTYQSGTLSITARSISLTAYSSSKIYDGTPLKDGQVYLSKGSLASGESLSSCRVSGALTQAGSTVNQIVSCSIVNADKEDVTSNYDITYVNGNLTVEKCPVTIASPSLKIQKGESGYDNSPYVSAGSLADGDWISYSSSSPAYSEVGTYENTITTSNLKIINANGVDVTSSYDISYSIGKITVV